MPLSRFPSDVTGTGSGPLPPFTNPGKPGFFGLKPFIVSEGPTRLPSPTVVQEGSQIQDTGFSTSAYSLPIPRTYGTVAVAGNLIWAGDLIRRATLQPIDPGDCPGNEIGPDGYGIDPESGKGGLYGGSETTPTVPGENVVQYELVRSGAWALCHGVIGAIRRLWLNNELVLDRSPENTGLYALPGLNLRLYTGTETQLQDPVMLAAGDLTPAYRGIAYVVIEDLDMARFGNSLPNLRAEVTTVVDTEPVNDVFIEDSAGGTTAGSGQYAIDRVTLQLGKYETGTPGNGDGGKFYGVYDLVGEERVRLMELYPSQTKIGALQHGETLGGFFVYQYFWNDTVYATATRAATIVEGFRLLAFDRNGTLLHANVGALSPNYGSTFIYRPWTMGQYFLWVLNHPTWYGPLRQFSCDLNELFSYGRGSTNAIIKMVVEMDGSEGRAIWLEGSGTSGSPPDECWIGITADHTGTQANLDLNTLPEFGGTENGQSIVWDVHTDSLIVHTRGPGALDGRTYRLAFNEDTGTKWDLASLEVIVGPTNVGTQWDVGVLYRAYGGNTEGNGQLAAAPRFGSNTHILETSTLTILDTHDDTYSGDAQANWDKWTHCVWEGARTDPSNSISYSVVKHCFDRYNKGIADLCDIVTDICLRHTLLSTEIDCSDLAGTNVRGYYLTRPMKGRTQIELLMQGFIFDCVETGGKVLFRFRDRPSTESVDEADLAAHLWEGRVPADQHFTHADCIDAPRSVQLGYTSCELEYETVNQYSRAFLSPSEDDHKMELPIVFSNDEAAQLSEKWLQIFLSERNAFTIFVNHEFVKLDATDVITVSATTTNIMRIQKIEWTEPGVLRVSAIQHDQGAFQSTKAGVNFDYGSSRIFWPAMTDLVLMDVPPLRSQDNVYGAYLHAGPTTNTGNWPGCLIARKVSGDGADDFVNLQPYEPWFEVNREGPTGDAKTALQPPTRAGELCATLWDYENTVEVEIDGDDTLESVDAIDVLNGSNLVYAESGELFQYRDAVFVSATRRWTLSALLRGRLGTEKFMDQHFADEELAININEDTACFVPDDLATRNVQHRYAPITAGRTLESTNSELFTNTGRILTPYSPASGRAVVSGTNINLTWLRRARVNGEWRDSVDVPLDETEEKYEVDILDAAGNVVRTVAVLDQSSFVYTEAMQIADLGSAQSTISAVVYQISDKVGRGDPLAIGVDFKEDVFTDFSQYAVLSFPYGWEFYKGNTNPQWNATITEADIPSNIGGEGTLWTGGQGMKVVTQATNALVFAWTAQVPKATQDQELLIKFRKDDWGFSTGYGHHVFVRYDQDADVGYGVAINDMSDSVDLFYGNISSIEILGNVGTWVTGASAGTNAWAFVRLRAVGTQIQAKLWQDNTFNEFGLWGAEVTDTRIPTGTIAVGGNSHNFANPVLVDWVSVAFNGRTAPSAFDLGFTP